MIELLIVAIIGIAIVWAFWNYTDISGRIATVFESFTLNPQEQAELKRMDEPSITSPEGSTVKYAPFLFKTRITPPPSPPKALLASGVLGNVDHPNRVENAQLGDISITDMPFLYPYPNRLEGKNVV